MRWLCYRYCIDMVYDLCVKNYPSPVICLARDRIAKALPFCIAMFKRCFSQSVSLFSPVFSAIRLPISYIMFLVDGPKTPEVSIAMGSNLYLLTKSGYFALLAVSALAAACHSSIAELMIKLSLNVLTHVASQQSDLPWLKGKVVIPSGLFPSPRLRPTGS